MPESALSLYELNHLVSQVIDDSFAQDIWVKGELLQGNVNRHYYGELVQRDERTDDIIARARITIWANTYTILRYRFENETGQALKPGLQLLLKVKVTFHPSFGYSLNVQDIDASYTLGDLDRRRREILAHLEADGIINDNRTLPMPTLLRRIAIISSDKAAGYGDFCDQLLNNEYGLYFRVQLFSAMMQGKQVEGSVLAALGRIAEEEEQWDAVVIIRGGGAVSDLTDFDSYPLAAAIAQFPLPVFVGIGHERDETVLDYVAHSSLKTPTAVAAYILDYQLERLEELQDFSRRITQASLLRIEREKQRMERLSATIPLAFARVSERQEYKLQLLEGRLQMAIKSRLEREQHRLQLMEQRVSALDPAILLQRGYSMTLSQGKLVTDVSQLKSGDILTTRLANGEVESVVRS